MEDEPDLYTIKDIKTEVINEFFILAEKMRQDAYANGMTEDIAQEIIKEIS